MEIIVFEKDAYYKMLEEVKQAIQTTVTLAIDAHQKNASANNVWCDRFEAQRILKCKRAKLKILRDEAEIIGSWNGKEYQYKISSLMDHLERKSF